MLKVHTVSGFNEIGKNMTVIETDDDAFIFDCGFHIPAVMGLNEKERILKVKCVNWVQFLKIVIWINLIFVKR